VGRPSRSLTLDQSLALLQAAKESRLNAYVVLSLTVGIRTEEARELRWDHVDLDGDPGAVRPMPPSVAVWHSVRTALAAAGPVPGGTDPASLERYAFAVAAGAVTSPGAPGAGPSRRVSRAAAGYGGVLR
jgi:hypothetical protein